MSTRLQARVRRKTADYTIVYPADAPGTIFTNAGATGAVIFTLPPPAVQLDGVTYRFLTIADYDVTVKTATADTLITLNDPTADSLAASTSSQKIGARMEATCVYNGTAYAWTISGIAVGHAFTIATS